MHRQIVTERDWMAAILDYIVEQLDGRLRAQYPDHDEIIDTMLENLDAPFARASTTVIEYTLRLNIAAHVSCLNDCMLKLDNCKCNPDTHEFMKEFLLLVWDARNETESWLLRQGIIPGQSVN